MPSLVFFHRSSQRLSLAKPFSHSHFYKHFSSLPLQVDLSHPIYMIWGSNTGVGKTLVSTGIAASVLSSPTPSKFTYIKPIQTGFPHDSDSRFVYRKVSDIFLRRKPPLGVLASNQAIRASAAAAKEMAGAGIRDEGLEIGVGGGGLRDLCWYEARGIRCEEGDVGVSELACKTVYGWKEAVSPHLAAEREGAVVEDSLLRDSLQKFLVGGDCGGKEGVWAVIETAGGIASPGPSGTLQCDLYRIQLRNLSGSISKREQTQHLMAFQMDPKKRRIWR